MASKLLVAVGGILALAGCGLESTSLRDESPADRCAKVMRAAMPKAEIAITAAKAAGDDTRDLNAIRATAEGRIEATAKGVTPGPVAMECVFHNGILVTVNWIAGPEVAAK
jgi:hypothetical protein